MSGSGLLKHETGGEGLPWWSSGWDSELPLQGAQVRSLIRGLESYIWCGTTKKIQPSPPQKKRTAVGRGICDERSRGQNTEGLQRADRDFEEGGLG